MDYDRLKSLVKKELPVKEVKEGTSYFILAHDGIGYNNVSINICTRDPAFSLYQRHQSSYLFAALAHEFGHFLSWKKGLRHKRYNSIMLKRTLICPKDTDIIYQEENIAWKQGELFVKNNGFQIDPSFYSIKRRCLQNYKMGH